MILWQDSKKDKNSSTRLYFGTCKWRKKITAKSLWMRLWELSQKKGKKDFSCGFVWIKSLLHFYFVWWYYDEILKRTKIALLVYILVRARKGKKITAKPLWMRLWGLSQKKREKSPVMRLWGYGPTTPTRWGGGGQEVVTSCREDEVWDVNSLQCN
jgi:hypothetical protein